MDITTITNYLQQPGFLIGVLFGFILATLIVILFASLRRQPDLFEAFNSEAGKVLISRRALQDQIQRCCDDLNDVGKSRATVIQKKSVLSIRIRLRLKSNAKLIGISGYLQQQISTMLRQNLGVENIGPIDIVVTGMLPHVAHEKATSIKPEEKSQT